MKRVVIVVLFVLLSMAMGCQQQERQVNRFRPGGQYAEMINAEGRRLVVEDAGGELLYKMRRRGQRYKIYDPKNLAPLGWVRWEKGEGQGGKARTLYIRSMGGEESATERSARAALELRGHFRVEPARSGYYIFGPHARLLAVLREGEQGWTLHRDWDGEVLRRAQVREGQARVEERNRVIASSRGLSAPALLALTIEEMPTLDRGVLAVWFESRQDG